LLGGGAGRYLAGCVGMKQRVIVVTSGRHPPECLLLGEFVVERPPARVGGCGWRRTVHGVAVVEGAVPWLGGERHQPEVALLAPVQPMLGVPVSPCEHYQLAVCGVGAVELDSCLEQWAQDGVATDAVIDVPTEVAIAFHNTRVFDENHWPI